MSCSSCCSGSCKNINVVCTLASAAIAVLMAIATVVCCILGIFNVLSIPRVGYGLMVPLSVSVINVAIGAYLFFMRNDS